MENTKHTSGEWLKDDLVSQEMNGDKLFRNHVFVYGANGNPNSNSKRATAFGKTKEECEANAKLIASSKTLLEILMNIKEYAELNDLPKSVKSFLIGETTEGINKATE